MSKFAPVKEQLDLIIRGTDEVIPIEELDPSALLWVQIYSFFIAF